jgi:hypothetical protein
VSIELIVKLAANAARANSPARRSIDACASALGVSLAPLHPSTSDRELATYFVARVDRDALDAVVARLLGCEGIEGAYAKPPGEPPERM